MLHFLWFMTSAQALDGIITNSHRDCYLSFVYFTTEHLVYFGFMLMQNTRREEEVKGEDKIFEPKLQPGYPTLKP